MNDKPTTLADLLDDFNAERIAEIARSEAAARVPAARIAREIAQGLRDAAGKLIVPEDTDDEE